MNTNTNDNKKSRQRANLCASCAYAYDYREGSKVFHLCTATAELRPYKQIKCNKYMMKTNRQIRRDRMAKLGYDLYKKALAKGLDNQKAIDEARFDSRLLVSDKTMRDYIKLMEANNE